MKKQLLTLSAAVCFLLIACQNEPKPIPQTEHSAAATNNESAPAEVPFSIAQNYFVKNTVSQLDNPKIETNEKFEEIFGKATTMGKEGQPTAIDFSKQYVIAVILPETDLSTTIQPVSLQKNAQNDITFLYRVVTGQQQSYKVRPSLAIIVDKTATGTVIVKAIH